MKLKTVAMSTPSRGETLSKRGVEMEKVSPDARPNGGNAGRPVPVQGRGQDARAAATNATEKAALRQTR